MATSCLARAVRADAVSGRRVQVQLTMVLYDQREYNRARRWRLPKCTLSPGEYQVMSMTLGRVPDGLW